MFGQSNASPFGSPPVSAPFGSNANSTPAFGSPAPAPFGSFGTNPGVGFGAPAPFGSTNTGFGAPASAAPFGTTSGGGGFGGGFGTTANTSPFGAPAPAPNVGLFGAPAPAPSGGLFGSSNTGGGFGSSSTNTFTGYGSGGTSNTSGSLFGAPAPLAFGAQAPSAFGAPAPTAFGAPAPSAFGAPAPSAFGAPAPSAFGASNTSTFGAPNSGGLFGAPAPASTFTGFGALTPAPSSGLFGAPAPAPGGSMFGSPSQPASGSVFGTPAASSSGLFGVPQQQQGVACGTSVAPYQASARQDGASLISLQSISAMAQYEHKSFEELRYEDYSVGNRGDGSGANAPAAGGGFAFGTPATGGFGAPTPAGGGLFGAPVSAPTAFGAPAPGSFGGAPAATGGFGAPTFGAPPAAPGGFSFGGSAPAPTFSGFGAKPPALSGGQFGAPAPVPTSGLFGTPAPTPSGGLFGSPAPAPFGAPATGGMFGSTPAPAAGGLFGAPAPVSGGLFGSASPAPAFGGFGAKPPAPSGGLFGAPPASGGLFGAAPASGGGLFGSPAPAPSAFGLPPASGGLFGPTAPAPTPGIFGAPSPSAPPPGYYGGYQPGPAPTIIPPAADAVLAQQLAAVQNQRKELEKLDVWRGKGPQQSSVLPSSLSESEAALWISPYSTVNVTSPYRAAPKSAAKIRPRGFGQLEDTVTSSALSQWGKGSSSMTSPGAVSSVKRLVIKPEAHAPKPRLRLQLADDTTNEDKLNLGSNAVMSPPFQMNGMSISTPRLPATNMTPTIMQQSPAVRTPELVVQEGPNSSSRTPTSMPTQPYEAAADVYRQLVGSPRPPGKARLSAGIVPKLTKSGYIVTPSLQELSKMSEVELATVSRFSVIREGFGSVAWEGAVDVRGVNLDTVVNIGTRDVSVYLEEELEGSKPPEGSKLNRPAIITLSKVFPKDGTNVEAMTKFSNKLRKSTATLGAEFISYDSTSGEWVFRVSHFSKYGVLDDDDSDDDITLPPAQTSLVVIPQNPPGKVSTSQGQFIGSPTRFTAPMDEDSDDESMENANRDENDFAIVSDVEMEITDEQILKVANQAYQSLSSPQPTQAKVDIVEDEESEHEFFTVEDLYVDHCTKSKPIPPKPDRLRINRSLRTCARIAQSRGVSLASDTDFGLRMGRSFRVGWSPTGAFLRIRPDGILVQSRPVFSESCEPAESLLDVHIQYSTSSVYTPAQLPCFTLTSGVTRSTMIAALNSYKESISSVDNGGSVVRQAFALLSCLLEDGMNTSRDSLMLTNSGRTSQQITQMGSQDAFVGWVRETCKESAMVPLQKAEQSNDAIGSVLSAMSCGDLELAADKASKFGYHQLAAMIAVGSTCAELVQTQIRQWQVANSKFVSGDMLRVFKLLAGDLLLEEELYKGGNHTVDWKRRLGMLLFYSSGCECGLFDPDSLVLAYQSGVDRGVAPKPQSEVCSGNETCLLYRLLSIGNSISKGEQTLKYSMAELISPLCHAQNPQDLSASFHLAVSLSAIGCCSPLSELELIKLYDGYAAQLVSNGRWELAVYVMLCSLGENTSQFNTWRYARAKQLVLSRYDSSTQENREFLVKIGLPTLWFEKGSSANTISISI